MKELTEAELKAIEQADIQKEILLRRCHIAIVIAIEKARMIKEISGGVETPEIAELEALRKKFGQVQERVWKNDTEAIEYVNRPMLEFIKANSKPLDIRKKKP